MPYIDLLFAGVPKSPVRAYLADAARRHKPSVVVIPCTGSFALADAALEGGMAAEKIVTGDISLYSSVIGAMLSGNDLPLTAKGPAVERVGDRLTDPISKAAAVLYMIRWCQTSRKPQTRIYWRDRLRDLEYSRDTHLEALTDQLRELRGVLLGLKYQARDLWETIAEYQNDPKAMIWLDPPWYAKGYDKMFAGLDECFDWPAPAVPQFDPKEYARLMETLATSPARAYVLYPTKGEDPAGEFSPPYWRSVFGLKAGATMGEPVAGTIWVMSNQPDDAAVDGLSLLKTKGPRFKLFDGEVKPDSDLRAVAIPSESGDYYRDLLVHNLKSGGSEMQAALLLDGQLFAIVGLHNIQSMFRGGPDKHSIHIIFHFPVKHALYPRLGKLMMLCLCCRWLWEDVLSPTFKQLELIGLPTEIQTTFITDHPSHPLTRGTTLKLQSREFDKRLGKTMLNYRGEIIPMGRTEVLEQWLKKYVM